MPIIAARDLFGRHFLRLGPTMAATRCLILFSSHMLFLAPYCPFCEPKAASLAAFASAILARAKVLSTEAESLAEYSSNTS